MTIKKVPLKDQIKFSLKLQILCYALTSLLLGVILFAILSNLGQHVLFSYGNSLLDDREIYQDVTDFQKYVSDNGLRSNQWEDILAWNGKKLYILSAQPTDAYGTSGHGRQNQRERERSKDERHSEVEQMMFPIDYADGTFQTWFLYAQPSSALFFTVFVCGLISFAVFGFILYQLLRRKLNYIQDIESGIAILEGGDLRYKIDVKGIDELGRLAASVNSMSESLSEKIDAEQRAVQSGREIIGDLSHDIRTPLTILSGYVPLLLESGPLTPQQREYLELIEKKTAQMSQRVNELLDYAVIYSGQRQPERIPLDVHTLVTQFAKELSPLGVVVTDETLPGIFLDADPALLERAFDNILSNLHKYADATQEIRLTCTTTDDDLVMEIDNAVSGTADCESASLGLKITSYIMEIHGGALTTHQKDNRFQTILRFPLGKDSVPA